MSRRMKRHRQKSQSDEIDARIERNLGIITKYLEKIVYSRGKEDLSLDDFKEIEHIIEKEGLNSHFDSGGISESIERKYFIKRALNKNNDAFDVGLATGIVGLLISILEGIYHLKKTYIYIPLWKKGRKDQQKRYTIKASAYADLLKKTKATDRFCDLGLIFGWDKGYEVEIDNYISLDALDNQATELLQDKALKAKIHDKVETVLSDVRLQACATGLLKLTDLILKEVQFDTLMQKIQMGELSEGKLLGVYYYEPDLLSQSLSIDTVLDEIKSGKNTNLDQLMNKRIIRALHGKIEVYKKLVSEQVLGEPLSKAPKMLFFHKDKFKRIDTIMRALAPYFTRQGKENRPVMLCLDKPVGDTLKCMCIAYRNSEGIYKRLRHLNK